MEFRLSGIGLELERPPTARVTGDLEDAVQRARRLLAEHAACEQVEIFAANKFVHDVVRPKADAH